MVEHRSNAMLHRCAVGRSTPAGSPVIGCDRVEYLWIEIKIIVYIYILVSFGLKL